MTTRTLLIGVISTVAVSAHNTEAFAGQLQIVHSIRFPGPAKFGADIAWDGQYIWGAYYESIRGPDESGGGSTGYVRSLDPVDGSPGPSFLFGQTFSDRSGIVWDGTHLWITLTSGIVNLPTPSPDHIYKFEPDGTQADFFELPGSPDIRATGLAFDGTYLWLSDARHDQIMQVDPEDMSLVKSFPSPGSIPLGLAWDGTSLWSVDAETDKLFRIDTSGNVLETWSTPLAGPFGITFDGEHFWILDNATSEIHQLAIPEPSSFSLLAIGVMVAPLFAGRTRGGRIRSHSPLPAKCRT